MQEFHVSPLPVDEGTTLKDMEKYHPTPRTRQRATVVLMSSRGLNQTGIAPPPVFSPDSKHVAYGAVVKDKVTVVLDGQEGKEYDGIVKGGKMFLTLRRVFIILLCEAVGFIWWKNK
jgi:hypothetical protein